MAFSLVAHVSAQYLGFLAGVTTSAIDTTGATLLVVSASGFQSSGSTGTLSDSKGNTWTALTERGVNGSGFQRLWYCQNPTVGTGHTFTIANGDFGSIQVAAFSGASVSSVFDSSTGTTGTSTSAQPGSITPANANSLVICGLSFANNGATLSGIDSGFSITDTEAGASIIQGSLAYLTQTGIVAENPTWTLSTSDNWVTSIAVFISAPTGVNINVPAGSLSFSTFAPAVSISGINITVPTGALTFTTFAPIVSITFPPPPPACQPAPTPGYTPGLESTQEPPELTGS